ncbi:TrbG/VirB9 family P-type conjugative transfer protein [Asticcacaulis sp.]|uniref:TrbG/VirB9 family P-type conjugative transfer protein n=1 Tax=Asticcacaulis sp. TaxID=1872648 RepID=UPI00391AEC57
MTLAFLPLFLASLLLPAAHEVAPALPVKPSEDLVIRVPYDEKAVVHVRVKAGVVTRIVLGADEEIEAAASGLPADCESASLLWCIRADKGSSSVWVRPKRGARSNNLELRSNRHDYSFELEVVEDQVRRSPRGRILGRITARPHYRVIFQYPQAVVTNDKARAQAVTEMTSSAVINRRYVFEPNKAGEPLVPLEMTDNGCFTRIRFASGSELPVVFKIASDGKEQRLVMQMENGTVVLHETAAAFIIRLGRAHVKVKNQGFDPRSENPACGVSAEPGLIEKGAGHDGR